MQWFKFSRDILHDPRMNGMSKAQKFDLVTLISLSCWGDEPGVITLGNAEIAGELRMSVPRWERFALVLSSKGMIRFRKEGCLLMAPWLLPHYSDADERSTLVWAKESATEPVWGGSNAPRKKPSDASERVRARVERSRKRGGVTPPVTPPVTPCNAPVTPLVTPLVTPCNAPVTPLVTPLVTPCNAPDCNIKEERRQKAEERRQKAEEKMIEKAEQSRVPPTPHESETSSALPALPSAASGDAASAPPRCGEESEHAAPLRSAEPRLSKFDENDLVKSGWTLSEIAIGVAILRERKLPPTTKVKGLLHTSILPEVREGRRPKAPTRKEEHREREPEAACPAERERVAPEKPAPRQALDAVWASLSREQRAQIDSEAVARLPYIVRGWLEKKPDHRAGREILAEKRAQVLKERAFC